jgi:hypothetical protein
LKRLHNNYNKNRRKKHGGNKKSELISEVIPKYQILKQYYQYARGSFFRKIAVFYAGVPASSKLRTKYFGLTQRRWRQTTG